MVITRKIAGQYQRTKSLSSQAAWNFLGRAASFGMLVLIPIVLVRIFSKNDFGIYRQVLLIYFFIERILQFGVRHSLFYFLAHDPENRHRYVLNAVVVFLGLGILSLIALWIFKNMLGNFFDAPALKTLLPWVGVYILMMLVSSPFETILILESRAEGASVVAFLTQVFRGVCTIALVLVFGTVFWGLMGLILYSTIRCVAYIIYVAKNYGLSLNKDNVTMFRKQIAYAAPMGMSTLIGTIAKRLDQFIVSMFFGPSVFAIYAIGCIQIPLVNTFFHSVGEVVMPKMVEHLKANRKDEFLALWHKLIIKMSFVGIGSFFLFQAIAYDLITLVYTDKFASSVPVFRIILVLVLSNMICYGLILRSLGDTRKILIANIIAFFIAVISTYPLVKYFGLIGAATSMVLVFNANVISQLIFSARQLKISFFQLFQLRAMMKFVLIAGGLSVVLFLCQYFVDYDNHPVYKCLRILSSTAIFGILYACLCHQTRAINILENQVFRKILIRLKVVKNACQI